MGMWRDSIIFKRTRLCNCIAFPVGREIGVATSVAAWTGCPTVLLPLEAHGVLFLAALSKQQYSLNF